MRWAKRTRTWTGVAVCLAMTAALAIAGRPEADALFNAKDWAGAASAYEQVVAGVPGDTQAWYRLGVSRHQLGQYPQAAAAYEKADAASTPPRGTKYNLACVYAMMGRKDDAFRVLDAMVGSGFSSTSTLQADPDFASLKGDARFKELLAKIDRTAHPCVGDPKARQFDFWVGEWDAVTPDGQKAGSSVVQNVVEGCIILENWTDPMGGTGKSINYYDPLEGKWHQDWVSSTGGIIHYVGEMSGGAMILTGELRLRGGTTKPARCTWTPQPDGRVRQMGEGSTDGGKTWTMQYDIYYAPRSKG